MHAEPETAPAGRRAMSSAQALAEIRSDVIGAVGAQYAHGILYGIGFSEGLVDALRLVRSFVCHGSAPPRRAGPALPILFDPQRARRDGEFQGSLAGSIEAAVHRESFGVAHDPICHLTAGYAAGWYTELLDVPVLVREHRCAGQGEHCCQFEARPLRAWERDADPWSGELLLYLDVESLRARARVSLPDGTDLDVGDGAETGVLGGFDAMSPAAHVWGPVVLLPYSGADDSLAAIDTILHDVGKEQLRVVIVDLQGVRLEPRERAGVARVLAHARDCGLQGILSGLAQTAGDDPPGDACDEGDDALTSTLHTRTLTEAVALGFQLVRAGAG